MKILFFRLGAIGDTLLTTPAVRKARALFPEAEIHYMAGEAAAEILENNTDINKVIVLKLAKHFLPREFGIFFIMPFLIKQFSKEKYDYFVDFESSYFSTYISLFIKATTKIGHKITQKGRKYLNTTYTKRVIFDDRTTYQPLRHLALVKELKAFESADLQLVLNLTNREKSEAMQYLAKYGLDSSKQKIMLCPSSPWITKSWPATYWLELVALINQKFTNHKIIILTGPTDSGTLLDDLSKLPNVHVWKPVKLRPLISLLSFGNILVANDGAVRHIANALKIKAIGIFGSTNDINWAFEDKNNIVLKTVLDCRPCHKPKCYKNLECLKEITPDKVFKAIVNLLG